MARFNLDDYETVEVRLEKFWAAHPEGRVSTDLVAYSDHQFIVKAAIYRQHTDTEAWATGYAEEIVTDRGVNATSALENCETSALGRALANAGFATKGKRPSRQEMEKVARREAAKQQYTDAQREQATEYAVQAVAADDQDALKAIWNVAGALLDCPTAEGTLLRTVIINRKAALEEAAA